MKPENMDSARAVRRETIELSNGLLLEAWDFSRKHAGDRWQVVLGCRIAVRLERSYFPPGEQGEAAFRKMESEYGPFLSYEFKDERNFVANRDLDTTWNELFEEFKEASLGYLSHPHFAQKFALSLEIKLTRNPYKLKQERAESVFNRLEGREASGL